MRLQPSSKESARGQQVFSAPDHGRIQSNSKQFKDQNQPMYGPLLGPRLLATDTYYPAANFPGILSISEYF
jgi:hypothetical protein